MNLLRRWDIVIILIFVMILIIGIFFDRKSDLVGSLFWFLWMFFCLFYFFIGYLMFDWVGEFVIFGYYIEENSGFSL